MYPVIHLSAALLCGQTGILRVDSDGTKESQSAEPGDDSDTEESESEEPGDDNGTEESKSAEPRDDNDTEASKSAEPGNDNDMSAEPGSARVIEALGAIDMSGRSLFALAVLSGKRNAVKWVHKFLAQAFKSEPLKVPPRAIRRNTQLTRDVLLYCIVRSISTAVQLFFATFAFLGEGHVCRSQSHTFAL